MSMEGDALRCSLNEYMSYWYKPVADSPMSLTVLVKNYDQSVHILLLDALNSYLSGDVLLFPLNVCYGQRQVLGHFKAYTTGDTTIRVIPSGRSVLVPHAYDEFTRKKAIIFTNLKTDASGSKERFNDMHVMRFWTDGYGEWIPRFMFLALERIFHNMPSSNPTMIVDRDGYPNPTEFLYTLMI